MIHSLIGIRDPWSIDPDSQHWTQCMIWCNSLSIGWMITRNASNKPAEWWCCHIQSTNSCIPTLVFLEFCSHVLIGTKLLFTIVHYFSVPFLDLRCAWYLQKEKLSNVMNLHCFPSNSGVFIVSCLMTDATKWRLLQQKVP